MAISIQDKVGLTCDNVPTQNGDNAVKSGGVFTALQGKQDKGKYLGVFADANNLMHASENAYMNVQVRSDGYFDMGFRNLDGSYPVYWMEMSASGVLSWNRINTNGTTEVMRTFTADEDTGWKNLIPVEFSVSGQAICRQKNGWVRIDLDFNSAPTMAKRAYTKLFTLPSGVAKPDHKVSAVASMPNSDGKVVVVAATNGEINAYNYSTTTEASGTLTAQIVYPV